MPLKRIQLQALPTTVPSLLRGQKPTKRLLEDLWFKMQRFQNKVIPLGNIQMGGMCEDLGLAWADQFTILGIDIDNKLQRLDDNFNRIDKKVRGIISRWTGYNLSFHGKITVCNTLLFSQYTYAGSILDCIKTKQMQQIQTQVDYFINHGKIPPNQELRKKGQSLD